jgi:hypothetical protein
MGWEDSQNRLFVGEIGFGAQSRVVVSAEGLESLYSPVIVPIKQ